MWRTLSTANIKGIGKTVTLAQALFSLLGYKFFGAILQLWGRLRFLNKRYYIDFILFSLL